jgi:hypothetical protein
MIYSCEQLIAVGYYLVYLIGDTLTLCKGQIILD